MERKSKIIMTATTSSSLIKVALLLKRFHCNRIGMDIDDSPPISSILTEFAFFFTGPLLITVAQSKTRLWRVPLFYLNCCQDGIRPKIRRHLIVFRPPRHLRKAHHIRPLCLYEFNNIILQQRYSPPFFLRRWQGSSP